LLKGPLGDFGTYKDIVYQNEKRRNIGITLGIDLPKRTQAKEARLQLTFAYRPQRREVILRESTLSDDTGRKIVTVRGDGTDTYNLELYDSDGSRITHGFLPRRARRMIHFLLPAWTLSPRPNRGAPDQQSLFMSNRRQFSIIDSSFDLYLRALRDVEYIGPFRAEPQRTNLFSGENPSTVGMDGAKAIDMLASDYLRRGRRKKELISNAVRWLKKAEIANDIKVRVLTDRHYEVLVQHPVTHEFENLADVGYGNSQVLPVIAAGYNLAEGATFMVEQPELHLHPKAQSDLGDFFADLYDRNVQCILETHSEHLILRLQRHVAEGRIRAEDLCVYFVYPLEGKKQAVKLTLGEDGIFREPWPRGFFEERLKEVTELSRASVVETR
jgi:hypothetical protein